jgi:hypothetical protein
MNRTFLRAGVALALAGMLLATAGSAQTRTQPRTEDAAPKREQKEPAFTPKFEAVAETRLLMEGMAHSNYRGLQKLLANKPTDNETWTFARGQAILIAETGNLLLLRPPRNNGRDPWMKAAMAMRDEAAELGRKIAARNHAQSKVQLQNLTNSCNKCHQTFRVNVKVGAEEESKEKDLRLTAITRSNRRLPCRRLVHFFIGGGAPSSQRRAVRSAPTDTAFVDWCSSTSPSAHAVCPSNDFRALPLLGSNALTLRSLLVVNRIWPPG